MMMMSMMMSMISMISMSERMLARTRRETQTRPLQMTSPPDNNLSMTPRPECPK